MTSDILLQVKTKLDRARSHHSSLDADIREWEVEHLDAVEASPVLRDVRYEYRVDDVPEMPALQWGAVIGDVLHNLRSALDYLAWHAAATSAAGDVKNPGRVVFPVASTPGLYDNSPATQQFSNAYKAFFEQFQPIHQWPGPDRWVGSYEHPLLMLQRLSNADKHRVITPVLGRQGAIKLPAGIPTAAVAAGATSQPVERGAVIFRIRKALVSAEPPPPVRVTPFVAFTSMEGVAHALRRLLGAVDHVYDKAVQSRLFRSRHNATNP